MAGTEVGTAYVSIVPTVKNFNREMRRQLVDPAGTAGLQAGKAAGAGVETGVRSGLSKLDGLFSSTFSRIAHLATVASLAGGAAIAGLGAFGLKSAADMQQVEIAFEGILGSGEKAKAFLDQLRDFAAKTPFEFPELAAAARQLLGVGFDAKQVIPIMTDLGNVAATLGLSGDAINGVVRALGQIKGKGKTSAEELQQISEAFPGFSAVAAIAASRGETVAQVFDDLQAGSISADEGIAAIIQGMHNFNGASGAMERQSKTLLGVLSTLKDTARDALVEGIAPILPQLSSAIEEAVPAIKTALGSVGHIVGSFATTFIGVFEKILPSITDIFGPLENVLGDAFKGIGDIIVTIAPDIREFVQALEPLISAVIHALVPAFEELAPAVFGVGTNLARSLLPVVVSLTPFLTTLAGVLARIVDALGPVGVLAVGFGTQLGSVSRGVGSLVGTLQTGGGAITNLSGAMSAAPSAIGAFTLAFAGTTAILETVFGKAQDVSGAVQGMYSQMQGLSKLTDDQLVKSFENLIAAQVKVSHTVADEGGAKITQAGSTLDAFRKVVESNLGAAQRLAEQYKGNNELYPTMARFIELEIAARKQEQADTQAAADAVNNYSGALTSVPPTVHTDVSVSVDTSLLQHALDLMSQLGGQGIQFLGVPGFASGGRPPLDMPSIVGEDGPELFIPDQPGTIVPFDKLQASVPVWAPDMPTSSSGGAPLTLQTTIVAPDVDRGAIVLMRRARALQNRTR